MFVSILPLGISPLSSEFQYTGSFLSIEFSKGVPARGKLTFLKKSCNLVDVLTDMAISILSECLCLWGQVQDIIKLTQWCFWSKFVSTKPFSLTHFCKRRSISFANEWVSPKRNSSTHSSIFGDFDSLSRTKTKSNSSRVSIFRFCGKLPAGNTLHLISLSLWWYLWHLTSFAIHSTKLKIVCANWLTLASSFSILISLSSKIKSFSTWSLRINLLRSLWYFAFWSIELGQCIDIAKRLLESECSTWSE